MSVFIIFDVILVAIVAAAVIVAKRRGFLRSSYNAITLIASVILILLFQEPFHAYLKNSQVGDAVRTKISDIITATNTDEEYNPDEDSAAELGRSVGLPRYVQDFLESQSEKQYVNIIEAKNATLKVVCESLTDMVLRLISILLLFLMVRITVFIALFILEKFCLIPLVGTLNTVLGMAVGAINGLLIVYVALGLIYLLVPIDKSEAVLNTIKSTYIVKYFYENNLLLAFFQD